MAGTFRGLLHLSQVRKSAMGEASGMNVNAEAGAPSTRPWIGQSIPRVEDPALLSGRGRFIDDICMPRSFVRPTPMPGFFPSTLRRQGRRAASSPS
jgi:hypothetical protein